MTQIHKIEMVGKTITTYVVFAVNETLDALTQGETLEVVTDALPAMDSDIRAWCRTTGNRLVDVHAGDDAFRFIIEKGTASPSGRKLAMVLSDDGLLELLSPLGFALAAALEGHAVSLFFQGPAVKVLGTGYAARLHGFAKPFSRFPRKGLAAAGHLPPRDKLRQLQALGAEIYACGPSIEHFKVDPSNLAVPDVIIAAYLTFMEQMDSADVQLFV